MARRDVTDRESEMNQPNNARQSGDEPDAFAPDDAIEVSEEAAEVLADLQLRLEEAIAAKQRAQADLVNFQRRARESEVRTRAEGVMSVARSLLPVLDHFDLALNQDQKALTLDQLLSGVQIVRAELNKALELHGVRTVQPERGEEFDPNLHQAVMRKATDEQPPNTIVEVLQPGYLLNDVVLRPATVVVAAAPDEAGE